MGAPHLTLGAVGWALVLWLGVPALCIGLGIVFMRGMEWGGKRPRNLALVLTGVAALNLIAFGITAALDPWSWQTALYLAFGLTWSGMAWYQWHSHT
jgi:hypothetical protein